MPELGYELVMNANAQVQKPADRLPIGFIESVVNGEMEIDMAHVNPDGPKTVRENLILKRVGLGAMIGILVNLMAVKSALLLIVMIMAVMTSRTTGIAR